ncbi:MAG: hypothetical protein COA96_02100 [SAR86 cluster bacterium]|uniref:Uncharacterized protein n=1 Tax=SAR86 cluster bacterium TaxID=2030880 RepID=A0A2A5BA34_9GAMM|nr:MAG: hypothetical protein COA96_02100 [SAR86 cluster bacterium]
MNKYSMAHNEPNEGRHSRDGKYSINVLYWAILWAISHLASTALTRWVVSDMNVIKWLVAVWPIAVSIGALRHFMRYLENADELTRKMEFESLSAGYGSGIIFSVGYVSLESAGMPVIFLGSTAAVMMSSYVVFRFRAARKYL